MTRTLVIRERHSRESNKPARRKQGSKRAVSPWSCIHQEQQRDAAFSRDRGSIEGPSQTRVKVGGGREHHARGAVGRTRAKGGRERSETNGKVEVIICWAETRETAPRR